jgi:hypothetical protein
MRRPYRYITQKTDETIDGRGSNRAPTQPTIVLPVMTGALIALSSTADQSEGVSARVMTGNDP